MRYLLVLFCGVLLAAEIGGQLWKWKPVDMPFHSEGLSTRERELVRKLVEASQYVEKIYWRQSDPEGLHLLQTSSNADIKRMLRINGSRYDLLDGNRPFIGSEPYLPGHSLYPPGLTRAEIEGYVKRFPDQKDAIYSPFTVVRKTGDKLETDPYRVAYRAELEPAAKLLGDAAKLSDDDAFARFLNARAEALLTDDYYPSDLLWVDLKNPKIDVIFAPYETYLDDVLGVKTSWEAAVLIRNERESAKLAMYAQHVPAIQAALPVDANAKPSKEGQSTPLEVMDAPFRAGDLRHGYQAVADNLPNDPRVHAAKGTKKIFFKNFMDARVNAVIVPLAREVMAPHQAAMVTGEGYLAAVVLHEICHGLGPDYAQVNGKRTDIREAIGPGYGALEEAKADVVGMFGLQWLIDSGALPKSRQSEYYASYVGGIFRTVRYGIAEAHGRAEMMEFNYLSEQGAIVRRGDRYSIQEDQIAGALRKLATELLETEATGNRDRADKWFGKYDQMPADLAATLAKVTEVPVDVDPHFDFPDLQ